MHKNVKITNISGAAVPTWLEAASISDARILIDDKGIVIFQCGIWEYGVWENGVWKDGTWKRGIWKDGTWKRGIWKDGTWEYGVWENGVWEYGVWEGGIWEGGSRLFVFSVSEGWTRIAFVIDGKLRIRAGCRLFSLSEAENHWNGYREDVYCLLEGIKLYCKRNNIEVD